MLITIFSTVKIGFILIQKMINTLSSLELIGSKNTSRFITIFYLFLSVFLVINCSNKTNSYGCEPERLIDEVLSKSSFGFDEIKIGYLRGYYYIDINDNDISYPRFFVPNTRCKNTVVYYAKSGSKIEDSMLEPPSLTWKEVYPSISLNEIYYMILWINNMQIEDYHLFKFNNYIYVTTQNCTLRKEHDNGEIELSLHDTHK